MKKLLLIGGLVFLFFINLPEINAQSSRNQDYQYIKSTTERALVISKRGNSFEYMNLRKYFGAYNIMLKKANDTSFIQVEIEMINNLMNTAQVSKNIKGTKFNYKDNYSGWLVKNTDDYNKGSMHKEIPLYESYTFFYVAQFLYYLKETKWAEKSKENKEWWSKAVHFIEKNLWEKWSDRSQRRFKNPNRWFMRTETNMASLWAGIAFYLNKMTTNTRIKKHTKEIVTQFDILLKRNLKIKNGGYVWNQTYDNTKGTDAFNSKTVRIQDVSHGNHVLAYVIAAYEDGSNSWNKKDLKRFAKTVSNIIYDSNNNLFLDNVDGTPNKNFPTSGNLIADGWLKLAFYDKEAKQIFIRFADSPMIEKKHQELQFKATLYAL